MKQEKAGGISRAVLGKAIVGKSSAVYIGVSLPEEIETGTDIKTYTLAKSDLSERHFPLAKSDFC